MLVIGRRWPFPLSGGVGSLIVPFEACSAFTRVRACWLAELPEAVLDTEGFGGFVAWPAAPVATGQSISCRVGLVFPLSHTAFPRRTRYLG